ncbi:hypothetical protein H311_00130, partial [Anncaliia algerae PRA109]
VANHINDDKQMLPGGPDIVFRIDKSCSSNLIKSHIGRAPQDQLLVFSIVNTSKFC